MSVYMHITSASISDVRVALVVLQALADVAIGHVGASAVAADARVAERWLLNLGRTPSVPDGEIDHVRHAPGEPVAGVAVQVRRRELVPRLHESSTTMAKEHGLVTHNELFRVLVGIATETPVSGIVSGREAWQQPRPEHDPLDASSRFPMSVEWQSTR